jgi:opacity protein-like surface antigen
MNLRTLTLAALALGSLGLQAQEGPRFGLQGSLSLPQGDLKDAVDSKMGYGLGAHMTFDLTGGHMLRPRLDATWYPKYTVSDPSGSLGVTFSNVALGADYLYFVEGKPQGLYFTGGLSAVRWKAQTDVTVLGISGSETESTTKLGVAAGLGYQFNKTVGAELRYQTSKVWDGNANSLQAGVTFRF